VWLASAEKAGGEAGEPIYVTPETYDDCRK